MKTRFSSKRSTVFTSSFNFFLYALLCLMSFMSAADPLTLYDYTVTSGGTISSDNVAINAYDIGCVDIAFKNQSGSMSYSQWNYGRVMIDAETVSGTCHDIMGIGRNGDDVLVGVSNSKNIKQWTRSNSVWSSSDTGYDTNSYAAPSGGYAVDPATGRGGFIFKQSSTLDIIYVWDTGSAWSKSVLESNESESSLGRYDSLVYSDQPVGAYKTYDSSKKLCAGEISGNNSLTTVGLANSWFHVDITATPDDTLYLLDSENSVSTKLYTSGNGGSTWTYVSQVLAKGIHGDGKDYAIAVSDDKSIIATLVFNTSGNLTLASSTDSGNTWDFQELAPGSSHMADLDFDADNNLYVVYYDSTDDTLHMLSTCLFALPENYGAYGNGVNDDTDALYAASQAIENLGGGTLCLKPNTTYRVGKQIHVNNEYPYYQNQPVIAISNATKRVQIIGNNATLKVNDNLRFGSFDKNTGAVYWPSLPFTDYDYRIDIGKVIDIENNSEVEICGLNIDGNIEELNLGGYWGDKGRQCTATGIYLRNNDSVDIVNVDSSNNALDGITINTPSLTGSETNRPVNLKDVKCTYNARQGLSWCGGIGLTAEDCKFNHTGRKRFSSSPGAGVDIEAGASATRDGHFINCDFVNNVGCGMVSDSGDNADVSFEDCLFWGTSTWAVWSDKPYFRFDDCTFYGGVVRGYPASIPEEGTQYYNCYFEDYEGLYEGVLLGVYRAAGMVMVDANYSRFDGCEFVANKTRALYLNGSSTEELLIDCTITHKDDTRADHDFQSLLRGVYIENTTFSEDISTNAYYITIDGVTVGTGVYVDGPNCKWQNWSWGIIGDIPET